MNTRDGEKVGEGEDSAYWRALRMLLVLVAAVCVLVGLLSRARRDFKSASGTGGISGARAREEVAVESTRGATGVLPRRAEEIVANKVAEFGKNRRAVVDRLAAHHQKEIPAEVKLFFEAVEAGNWEEIERLFQSMAKRSAQYEGSTHDPALDPFWPAVLEAFGAAEQAHLWPAQQLIEYSEEILGRLKPGMVYVGGTDPGRFIPTLVNETSSGEQHVILTQNALADSRYQEYIRFLYGERIELPAQPDVDRAFADYIADATKRLEHDEKFPNEPKQLRAREKVERVDGKVQASGFDAVMDINERILNWIIEKNAARGFAMEESLPMKSLYEGAEPLGPIFQLRAGSSAADAKQQERTMEYWRERSSQLLQDSAAANSPEVLKTWSKMIVGHGNLLSHHAGTRAEDAYRLALEVFPRNTDAIIGLSEHLAKQGQVETARELVRGFSQRNPDLKADLDRIVPQFR